MKVVCYSIKHLKPAEVTRFQRELYGFKDMSNNGKYEYRRQGLMGTIVHEKIYYTGLLVRESHVYKLMKLMKKHNAKAHVANAPR
jgi:hypothetical protein